MTRIFDLLRNGAPLSEIEDAIKEYGDMRASDMREKCKRVCNQVITRGTPGEWRTAARACFDGIATLEDNS